MNLTICILPKRTRLLRKLNAQKTCLYLHNIYPFCKVLGLQWSRAHLCEWLESPRARRVPFPSHWGGEKNQSLRRHKLRPHVARLNWQSCCPLSTPRCRTQCSARKLEWQTPWDSTCWRNLRSIPVIGCIVVFTLFCLQVLLCQSCVFRFSWVCAGASLHCPWWCCPSGQDESAEVKAAYTSHFSM